MDAIERLRHEIVTLRLSRRSAMKRAAALGVSATAAAALLPAAPRARAAQAKARIRMGTWAAVDEAKELQGVIDKVNAAATDFEIVSEPQPADYYTKLQTTIAGGTAPDLFWLSQEYVAGYASLGAILDISDRLAKDDAPAAKLDDYFPEILKTGQYQDKTYGLPWIAQPVMLYYNPDLLQAAGVAEPDESWTWDTFKDAAAKVTDASKGIYGTSFNSWPPIHMFMWQAGGETIAPDLGSCPIDSDGSLQGADFYASIIYNKQFAVPEATITDQGFGEMAKGGKVALFYGGATDDLDYAHTKDPKNAVMKMAVVPKGPKDRTTFAWTASTVVNAKTKDPDAAYQALVALTEGIHHWKIVAPRKSLANAETIAQVVPDKAGSAAIIVKSVADMRAFNIIPKQTEWDQTFFDEFQDPLFHGEGDARGLAKDVRPMLEDLLP